jgi:pyruvate,orthophosphate dikinase
MDSSNENGMSTSEQRWVYPFSEPDGPGRDLLGGKGAELANLARLGLPVPPGFTITTEACRHYLSTGEPPESMWAQIDDALSLLERESGRTFGHGEIPLLVSVRSGAAVSMPGMMDTVLNLGINDEVVGALAHNYGLGFALDVQRRFMEMFAEVVFGVSREPIEAVKADSLASAGSHRIEELEPADARELLEHLSSVIQAEALRPIPFDPRDQLKQAVMAVFESWNTRRAKDYRAHEGIPDDLGTAVNIVAMVYGNVDDESCSGVLFTRDPATGEKRIFGEYLTRAQGEDVVAGSATPLPLESMAEAMPDVHKEILDVAARIEAHYGDAQDIEFTVERRQSFILQTREAKRSARAAVRIAVEMCDEGILSREQALLSVPADQVYQLLLPRLDETDAAQARDNGRLLTVGLGASPGGVTGVVALSADGAVKLTAEGQRVVLVRPVTSAEDVHGIIAAAGVLTARGGATSHAAVVARGLGKPCIVGAESLEVRADLGLVRCAGKTVKAGDEISIDGGTGEVFIGTLSTVEARVGEEHHLARLLGWADEFRRLGVRANADAGPEAALSREFGADGVGLCRTEHMFFEPERLDLVRQMILAASAYSKWPEDELNAWRYRQVLKELQGIQSDDFEEILTAMDGMPVVIRLLDPPLHEFLPSHEELLDELHEMREQHASRQDIAEREELLAAVDELREANPMLGLRGCRLGIVHPEIFKMQVLALTDAVRALKARGMSPRPEVMVPLVSDAGEMNAVRAILEEALRDATRPGDEPFAPSIGAMIETPRAALLADEIAESAEFFSFGTNDLTQMTFGFSRDDAEGKFLVRYLETGVLQRDPFQTLDQQGVGGLVKTGMAAAKRSGRVLEAGVCGEHGGDPESIDFFERAGLDYVSCSPYRVPVARLAAAQAAIRRASGNSES